MWNNALHNFFRRRLSACLQSKLLLISTVGQLCAYLTALILFSLGAPVSNDSLMMIGTLFVWMASVFYCIGDIRKRLLLLSFDVVVFVFLICRPLIDILRNAVRWHYYAPDSVHFAITAVAVSLFCLHIGALLGELLLKVRNTSQSSTAHTLAPKSHNVPVFRLSALLLYLFCMAFFLVRGIDVLVFMQGRSYNEYYTAYRASYPSFVYTISEMMPYALCIYLATLPSKRNAYFTLGLYVLSAVPELLVGIRNPIVLHVLFAFLYFCLRDILGDTRKWVGRLEKVVMVVTVPFAAFGLSLSNYFRTGVAVEPLSFFDAIVDLFYKQGVSFDVLCMGHNAIPRLPGGTKCYILGPIIDAFLQGRIGQALFHVTPFPNGNSAIRAIEGHTFSHCMSYVAHPDYLNGQGWGSSYILETYADLGWVGIILFSLLLGLFLIWFIRGMKQHWLTRTILLVTLTQLLFLPRSEATGWLAFLTKIHFWFILFVCIAGSKVLEKMLTPRKLP